MKKTFFTLLCAACILPLTGARASTVTYAYDALGRLTGATYGDSLSIHYTYDLAGNILSVTVVKEPQLAGDFDDSGTVDFTDFFLFADAFGGTDATYDLNGSGLVDFDDFFLFADALGKSVSAQKAAGKGLEISDRRLVFQAGFREGELRVEVDLDRAQDARGYGLVLRFDPQSLRYREARAAGSEGLLLVREGEPGHLFLGRTWPEGSAGDSLELLFEVLRDDPVLQVAEGAVRESGQVRQLLLPEVILPHLPGSFALAPNYPNPFNSNTVIRFSLPTRENVRLSIYNLAGQKVATLLEGNCAQGTHTVGWDGADESGRESASGVYVYRLQAGGRLVETRKLVLVR